MNKRSHRMIYLTMFIVFINVILVLLLIIPQNHHQPSHIKEGSEAAYIVEWTEEVPVNSLLDRSEYKKKGDTYFVTLEKQLVDSKIDGEILIETFQEFEIYKNQYGEVVQIIPTSNFDYLRYSITQ
ncbi:hypothetical protein VQL36_10565 [Chengkuizengella sp. SCS-71B]|uniref:hypothetical protein n=1 Tax=Chengkuizengella sp. SCS-71B TaxID=3115290 RepID=UPI0032C22FD2